MKKGYKLLSMVIGFFVCFGVTAALAEDFSADMVHTTKGGIFKGKIFIAKDKTRMETKEGITISRLDKKTVWIIMPKEKMYMEQAFDPQKAVATQEKMDGEIERKLIGQEMIDGKAASKYQVVYNQNGKRETVYQWFATGLKMPVKTAAVDNSWTIEYKNIKTGKQPDSLFEVPADYQKFSYQMPSMKDVLKGFGK